MTKHACLITDVIIDWVEAINPHYWLDGHTSQQGPFCLRPTQKIRSLR